MLMLKVVMLDTCRCNSLFVELNMRGNLDLELRLFIWSEHRIRILYQTSKTSQSSREIHEEVLPCKLTNPAAQSLDPPAEAIHSWQVPARVAPIKYLGTLVRT